MTSILLRCNICPREPEFSDISHLLTHVASKGHLAQQFKAQVRARQDASIRAKLDAYDRWYDRHQIEKLLSERMLAKDSKDSSSRAHKNKGISDLAPSTKDTNSRKRRSKGLAKPEDQASPVKVEDVLDPELCRSVSASRSNILQPSGFAGHSLSEDHDSQREVSEQLAATPHHNFPSPFLSQTYQDYHHRAYVPRMSEWQSASSPHHAMTGTTLTKSINNQPLPLGYDTDGESDYFQTFLRSPTRTAYPDPSEVPGQRSEFLNDPSSSVIEPASTTEQSSREVNAKDSSIKGTGSIQSPVLKGVKWPGMSLFDSASLDAQRLRNQKKDESVLEQMEHNSAMVEQMERIYWPDGSLKKQRLITGNVDSSPIREPTPPPKLSKRRRMKAESSILVDLSTNAPSMSKKVRTRKIAPPSTSTRAPNLRTISTQALAEIGPPQYVYPRSAHVNQDPPNDDECERELTHGLPKLGRKKAFHIFNDHSEWRDAAQSHISTKTNDLACSQSLHGHQGSTQPSGSGIALGRVQMCGPRLDNHELYRDSQSCAANVLSRVPMNEDSENIAPVLDGNGRIDDEAAPFQNGRVTQRYFSVTGNQPPQFFSSMPPGMDFGGLMEPRYHGSTLNPLNAYLGQQRFVHSHTRDVLTSQQASLSTGLVGDHGLRDQPDPHRLGSRTTSKRT